MKLFLRLVLFLSISLSFTKAQTNQSIFRKDTLKILAIMVEFQADKYDATIGTGKFGSHYTQNYGDTIMDPLPHNKEYFSDHLLFAQNYFKKVSNGKLNVKYNVLPDVITLPKMMREYSPPYKSKDLSLLAALSKESWELVSQMYPQLNFDDYDLFVVFHAGVSNGLSNGSYEVDKNLPSLYLGENSFKKVYGTGFNGLLNIGGKYFIKNSIIMPETESREQTAIDDSKILIQISINGFLVSNIASFLGLPDLYNTETGISAIGRFGLMDGQAMVANSGLFPPEPSAWEKVYLGWVTPSISAIKDIKATISSYRSASLSDTTMLKIPINDFEYFLVENRQQDALKDGIKLTYKKGGSISYDLLHPDSAGYFEFKDSNIKGGVVIDVDEFDAALKGNGIVIWHIDEKVINEKITTGGINNDKLRKGVNVVEADGILDVGEITKSIFSDIIGDGTIEDFWYFGNTADYYKNKFSDDSKPSAKANNGSNSFITMQNFSVLAPKMSFDLKFGGIITQKYTAKLNFQQTPASVITIKEGIDCYNYLLINNNLTKIDKNGNILKSYANFSHFKPLYFIMESKSYLLGVKDKNITLLDITNGTTKSFQVQSNVSTPPVYQTSANNNDIILFGTENGEIVYSLVNTFIANSSSNLQYNLGFNLNYRPIQICATLNYYVALSENKITDNLGNAITIPYKIISAALTQDKNGRYINVLLTEGNRFFIIAGNSIISEFKINELSEVKKFILSDISNNGETSIVFTAGNRLYAVTQNGIVVENYPVSLFTGNLFLPEILTINYDSDKSADLITYTTSGDIYFINGKTAKVIKGLSLSTGSAIKLSNLHPIDNSPRVPITDDLALTVITDNNSLYTWDLQLPSTKKIWHSEFGDYSNSSFIPQSSNDVVFEKLLPEGKVYNWPNPVYGEETNIRFVVNEDSRISIKIFDMGGQIAAEFLKDATANVENEVIWNVRNIKSGPYFARVEAVSKSGKTEIKIVKIVVIK